MEENKETLLKRKEELNKMVEEAKIELNHINKKLKKFPMTIIEKLELWQTSKKKHYDYITWMKDDCPLLYQYFSKKDISRYQTVKLENKLEELIFPLLDGEATVEEYTPEELALLEEMCDKNVKSFTYDW